MRLTRCKNVPLKKVSLSLYISCVRMNTQEHVFPELVSQKRGTVLSVVPTVKVSKKGEVLEGISPHRELVRIWVEKPYVGRSPRY